MKKIVILIVIMFLLGTVFLSSVPDDKQDLYIKAVSEKDPEIKIQLLRQYHQLYGDKQDNYSKFIYIQLAESLFQVKNYQEAITFGEKALESADLPATNKLTVLFALANSYYSSQKDFQKAFDYAASIIETANWVIDKAKNSDLEKAQLEQFIDNYNKYYLGPACRLQALALYAKEKGNPEVLKEAAQKACDAYKVDNSENSSRLVFSLANELFKLNQVDDAITIAEKAFDETNPTERTAAFLATLYIKKGDKEKAVHYFELAYNAKKDLKLAMNIGQLVYKKDLDKGIQYFADAYILSNLDENSDAFKYLRQLYYREKAKNLPAQEQEKGFNEIIQAAKARMEPDSVSPEAANSH